MNLIPIKKSKIIKNNQEIEVFIVPAMSITQSDGKLKKIPHPDGNDTMSFSSLEKATEAVNLAGFSYSQYKSDFQPERHEYGSDSANIIKALTALLNDKSPEVIASAAFSLGEIASPDCIKPLVSLLEKDDHNIRRNAIEALVKIGEPGLSLIIKALNDQNWVTRNSAAICLGEMTANTGMNLHAALGPLLERFNDSNSIVKSSAALALGRIYKTSVKPNINDIRR